MFCLKFRVFDLLQDLNENNVIQIIHSVTVPQFQQKNKVIIINIAIPIDLKKFTCCLFKDFKSNNLCCSVTDSFSHVSIKLLSPDARFYS